MGDVRDAWSWFVANRRRFAPLLVVLVFALIGSQLLGVWPHETTVHYSLGDDHDAITDARIAYRIEGAEAAGTRFHWEDGAPNTVRHVVTLHPGRYTISAELRGERLTRDVSRALEVPADGVVRVDLGQER